MVMLGFDAAWTRHHGIVIVIADAGAWRCVAAVSSINALQEQAAAHRRG
jgi:hypothetical protein